LRVCVIKKSGALVCFGDNGNGGLGSGEPRDARAPNRLKSTLSL
jgi:hypothetical protein